MYAILKPLSLEDLADLQYSFDLFHCGEATGNPHIFDTQEDADEYREAHGLDGKIIELFITD
ncbi:MAG: hypothetical protein D6772_13135 [Bacteroidetes bacterium]|nr:MAG: hypothetical protein D6772_13135 [Bacteroidota bacterium]